ncbi:hypothetical protein [Modestobacter sp. Leaf380]|uniref:hypothetical protein n=1 Tax=Modestobacter sp. Leaf380 TaxID=1736356 RepID=UPI0006F357EF|nr:hypothetical protein [Modestobacter sp. Leaf380]KQS73628.1 hypothetical protein ASG41_03130 [Modestobacter sp. Leaf380]
MAARSRRPLLRATLGDHLAGEVDPIATAEAARGVAYALVDRARVTDDPEVTRRLVTLADDEGLDELAELWADSPAVSLPGSLWRLYLLRAWVQRDPVAAARQFEAGRGRVLPREVVAGLADPPGPDGVRDLADAVLTGVFEGDLDVALDRAAAFCWVVAGGRAALADELDDVDSAAADRVTRGGHALGRTADQLAASARRWRAGTLP